MNLGNSEAMSLRSLGREYEDDSEENPARRDCSSLRSVALALMPTYIRGRLAVISVD